MAAGMAAGWRNGGLFIGGLARKRMKSGAAGWRQLLNGASRHRNAWRRWRRRQLTWRAKDSGWRRNAAAGAKEICLCAA